MKRFLPVMIATLLAWLIATFLYLILTLPLEWSEWSAFNNAVNKVIAAAFGHAIYAVLIFIIGLCMSLQRLGVRLILGAACIGLCVLIFGLNAGSTSFDWLQASARWITAASMPFVFYAAYSRLSSRREEVVS